MLKAVHIYILSSMCNNLYHPANQRQISNLLALRRSAGIFFCIPFSSALMNLNKFPLWLCKTSDSELTEIVIIIFHVGRKCDKKYNIQHKKMNTDNTKYFDC